MRQCTGSVSGKDWEMLLLLCYSQDLPDVSAKFTALPILTLLPYPSVTALGEKEMLNCCCDLSSAMTKAYRHVCNKPPFLCPQYKIACFSLLNIIRKFRTEITTPLARNILSPPNGKKGWLFLGEGDSGFGGNTMCLLITTLNKQSLQWRMPIALTAWEDD